MSKRKKSSNSSDLQIWLTWDAIEEMKPHISTESLIQRVCDDTGKSYATVVSAMTRHPEARRATNRKGGA